MNKQPQLLSEIIPKILRPPAPVFGVAAGLQYKRVSASGVSRRYMLSFRAGDDVIAGLYDIAQNEQLRSATFTAIGALRQVAFAWFDVTQKAYKTVFIEQQCELVGLTGNISKHDDKFVVHTHGSVTFEDGTARGGHLICTDVFPTVELILDETDFALERSVFDEEAGAFLLKP